MVVVLDINVVVSAVFWGGKPLEVMRAWVKGKFKVVGSPEIIWEYERTLMELAKGKITPELHYWFGVLNERVRLIQPSRNLKICRDPNDDKFLNCAASGKADYLISGDKDLLVLKKVEGIEILQPSNFLMKHPEMSARSG